MFNKILCFILGHYWIEIFDYSVDRCKRCGKIEDWNLLSEEPEVHRVDGRYVCTICGKQARDHPDSEIFPYPTFRKLCDGREVKV